jgi:hypothetical protein
MSDGTANIPPSDDTPNIPPEIPPPMEYPPPDLSLQGYPPLTDADREALTRALSVARRESEQQRHQIDRMLMKEGFGRAAAFSSYCCQDAALQLKPWEKPICWLRASDPDALVRQLGKGPDQHDQSGLRRAALILRRLHKLGLSRFEPDPLGAIERAEVKLKKPRGTN